RRSQRPSHQRAIPKAGSTAKYNLKRPCQPGCPMTADQRSWDPLGLGITPEPAAELPADADNSAAGKGKKAEHKDLLGVAGAAHTALPAVPADGFPEGSTSHEFAETFHSRSFE